MENQTQGQMKIDYRNFEYVKLGVTESLNNGNELLAIGLLKKYEYHRTQKIQEKYFPNIKGVGGCYEFVNPNWITRNTRQADHLADLSDIVNEHQWGTLFNDAYMWNREAVDLTLQVLSEYKNDLDAGRVRGNPSKYPDITGRKLGWYFYTTGLSLEQTHTLAGEGLRIAQTILEKRWREYGVDYSEIKKLKDMHSYFRDKKRKIRKKLLMDRFGIEEPSRIDLAFRDIRKRIKKYSNRKKQQVFN